MSEFMRGDEVPNTLWNLLDWFQRSHSSHLAAAMATDVEAYEQTHDPDAPEPPPVRRAPEMAEVDLVTSLLMGIHELLQHNIGWTAASAPKGARKPKVKPLPRPKTAAQLYALRQAREDMEFIEANLVRLPTAEWERRTAEYTDTDDAGG